MHIIHWSTSAPKSVIKKNEFHACFYFLYLQFQNLETYNQTKHMHDRTIAWELDLCQIDHIYRQSNAKNIEALKERSGNKVFRASSTKGNAFCFVQLINCCFDLMTNLVSRRFRKMQFSMIHQKKCVLSLFFVPDKTGKNKFVVLILRIAGCEENPRKSRHWNEALKNWSGDQIDSRNIFISIQVKERQKAWK